MWDFDPDRKQFAEAVHLKRTWFFITNYVYGVVKFREKVAFYVLLANT